MLEIILEYDREKKEVRKLNRGELKLVMEYDTRCKERENYGKVKEWLESGLAVKEIKFLLLADGGDLEITSYEWLRRYYFSVVEKQSFRGEVGHLLGQIVERRGDGVYEIKAEYGGGCIRVSSVPDECKGVERKKMRRRGKSEVTTKEQIYKQIKEKYNGVSGVNGLLRKSLGKEGVSGYAIASALSSLVKDGLLRRVERNCYEVVGDKE